MDVCDLSSLSFSYSYCDEDDDLPEIDTKNLNVGKCMLQPPSFELPDTKSTGSHCNEKSPINNDVAPVTSESKPQGYRPKRYFTVDDTKNSLNMDPKQSMSSSSAFPPFPGFVEFGHDIRDISIKDIYRSLPYVQIRDKQSVIDLPSPICTEDLAAPESRDVSVGEEEFIMLPKASKTAFISNQKSQPKFTTNLTKKKRKLLEAVNNVFENPRKWRKQETKNENMRQTKKSLVNDTKKIVPRPQQYNSWRKNPVYHDALQDELVGQRHESFDELVNCTSAVLPQLHRREQHISEQAKSQQKPRKSVQKTPPAVQEKSERRTKMNIKAYTKLPNKKQKSGTQCQSSDQPTKVGAGATKAQSRPKKLTKNDVQNPHKQNIPKKTKKGKKPSNLQNLPQREVIQRQQVKQGTSKRHVKQQVSAAKKRVLKAVTGNQKLNGSSNKSSHMNGNSSAKSKRKLPQSQKASNTKKTFAVRLDNCLFMKESSPASTERNLQQHIWMTDQKKFYQTGSMSSV